MQFSAIILATAFAFVSASPVQMEAGSAMEQMVERSPQDLYLSPQPVAAPVPVVVAPTAPTVVAPTKNKCQACQDGCAQTQGAIGAACLVFSCAIPCVIG